MTGCVAITRDGRGELYLFETLEQADEHPIVQYGDRLVDGPRNLLRRLTLGEIPRILRRVEAQSLAERIETLVLENAALSHRAKLERVSQYSDDIWSTLLRCAASPPSEPELIINLIVRDRKLSKKESKMEDPTKTNPETVAPEAAPTKKTRAKKTESTEPKEAKEPAPRHNPEATITLLKNAEGVQYGPENNPKRPGSASADRFALYRSGMTVKAAVEAGVKSEDISWDQRKGFIELTPPAAV